MGAGLEVILNEAVIAFVLKVINVFGANIFIVFLCDGASSTSCMW
jgi:hypothetical protein